LRNPIAVFSSAVNGACSRHERATPSPASRAGLRPGDLLASLGGEPTRSVGDVQRYLGRAPTGSRIEATVIRGGRRLSLAVVLAAARD
jgi:serine protease Do